MALAAGAWRWRRGRNTRLTLRQLCVGQPVFNTFVYVMSVSAVGRARDVGVGLDGLVQRYIFVVLRRAALVDDVMTT